MLLVLPRGGKHHATSCWLGHAYGFTIQCESLRTILIDRSWIDSPLLHTFATPPCLSYSSMPSPQLVFPSTRQTMPANVAALAKQRLHQRPNGSAQPLVRSPLLADLATGASIETRTHKLPATAEAAPTMVPSSLLPSRSTFATTIDPATAAFIGFVYWPDVGPHKNYSEA